MFSDNRPQNILRKHKKQVKLSRPASTNSKWSPFPPESMLPCQKFESQAANTSNNIGLGGGGRFLKIFV